MAGGWRLKDYLFGNNPGTRSFASLVTAESQSKKTLGDELWLMVRRLTEMQLEGAVAVYVILRAYGTALKAFALQALGVATAAGALWLVAAVGALLNL